jgi:pimeloyl-ACP methyl ester carboxylesterase
MAFQLIDKIAVEDEGDGDAVVCVHGLGGTSNTWTPADGRVEPPSASSAMDLPGSGRSHAALCGPLSIARWVDAMQSVCARLGITARTLARPFDGHDRLPAPRGRAAEAGAQPRAVRGR